MKLTTLLLIIAFVQVSAAGFSQVNLKVKDAPVEKVLQSIKEQTGYYIFYPDGELSMHNVTLHLQHATLQQALDSCFKNQPVTYKIIGKNIVLSAKAADAPSAFFTPPPAAHDIRVHITDSTGSPLQGASVVVKGTKQGGQTDADGNITLAGITGDETLVISYVGYETKEISIGDNTVLSIILRINTGPLDEIKINAGYYTTTRRTATGSISRVTAETIDKQPVSDALQALQGRVPGLIVNQINGTTPGGAMDVKIRGTNSIAAGTTPLYIVDGVPYPSSSISPQGYANQLGFNMTSPFNSINPQDIESIEVLKDADATSLYGSRGANGVILITTRKGKAGKTKVEANVYGGFGRVTSRIDVLGLKDYLQIRREAFANDGITPTTANAPDLLVWDTTKSTDFQDMLMGKTAPLYDANVSLSGGNAQTRFLLSGSYRHQGVVMPADDLGLKRASAKMSVDHSMLHNRLNLNASVLFSNEKNIFLPDVFAYTFLFPPNYPLYDSLGRPYFYSTVGNYLNTPTSSLLKRSKNNSQNFTGNLSASLDITKGLNFKTSLGYTHLQTKQDNLSPSISQNPGGTTPNGSATFGSGEMETFIVEPQLNYQRKIGRGELKALAGATYQQSNSSDYVIYGTDFINDDLIEDIKSAATIQVSTNTITEYKYASLFARAGYEWDKKYIINLNYRKDASSRFGPGKRTGEFGAAGIGWIFSEENFVKNGLPFLSFGKLRASYGTSGNDQIPDYGYLPNYGTSFTFLGATLIPLRIANPDYSWETNRKLEFGLELGFIKDRLLLTANYFRNRSDNQLVSVPLPGQAGFTSYIANLPAEIENTGLELDITAHIIQSKNFTWTTNINLTAPQNKLLSFPGIENSTYANTYMVGRPLDLITGYIFKGVDPATGQAIIEDLGNDGVSDVYGPDWQYLGKSYPDMYGGVNNEIRYKNFSLSFLFQYSEGSKNYSPQRYSIAVYPGGLGNNLAFTRNRWREPGDITTVPKATTQNSTAQYNFANSDRNVVSDASFIRLTNLYLSYNIQTKKAGNWMLYIAGQNIFTITSYPGLDPETGYTFMPPLQIWTGGVKISL